MASPDCIAQASKSIRAAGFADGGVGFEELHPDTPTAAGLDWIAVIATPDFFVQCQGFGNTTSRGVNWRVWGYRATADADTYAALVQSEALSV